MSKIPLIIKREYLTRVRKRTFVISTILFPVLYLGLVFGTGYLADKSRKTLHVAVIDSSGHNYFTQEALDRQNKQDPSSVLTVSSKPPDSVVNHYKDYGFDGYLVIPPTDSGWQRPVPVVLHAGKAYGTASTLVVANKLNAIWNSAKNEYLGIDAAKQEVLQKSRVELTLQAETNTNADAASGIGYACGLLIYLILIIYGSQVMMGVMEERTNRIAEVIVSSVRPFQMMIGKIVGIGLVGLTQFLIWIGFMLVVYNVSKASGGSTDMGSQLVSGMQKIFGSVNLAVVLVLFAFYFLAGFFFYASLYAAIGSTVNEDMREAQSLSFPITLLVIMSIALMSSAIANPTGPVAVWASIIPFSSPIVMMARVPFGVPGTVPLWQLGLSMGVLVAGFIFTSWFAGKIYRTGILMYGKKPTWKEMMKWAFRKN